MCVGPRVEHHWQGWRQDLPDGRLGSPERGPYNRTEGIFLSIRTQFSVKNSLTGIKFFSDRERAANTPRRGSGATVSLPPLAPALPMGQVVSVNLSKKVIRVTSMVRRYKLSLNFGACARNETLNGLFDKHTCTDYS